MVFMALIITLDMELVVIYSSIYVFTHGFYLEALFLIIMFYVGSADFWLLCLNFGCLWVNVCIIDPGWVLLWLILNEIDSVCYWFWGEIWGKGFKSDSNVLWYNIVELMWF